MKKLIPVLVLFAFCSLATVASAESKTSPRQRLQADDGWKFLPGDVATLQVRAKGLPVATIRLRVQPAKETAKLP